MEPEIEAKLHKLRDELAKARARRTIRPPTELGLLLQKANERADVRSILPRLSEEARMMLMLREVERFTYTELSEMTGQSEVALKMQVVRAREQFSLLLLARFQPTPEVISLTHRTELFVTRLPLSYTELLALTSREFEELIAGVWTRFGYQVELTARTKDGGRDIIAVRKAEAETRFLIECKRYSPENKVGVSLVRALYGVKVDEKATKAILATTSTFTTGAKRFFDAHRWELERRDHQGVLDWLKHARQFGGTQTTGLWVPGLESK